MDGEKTTAIPKRANEWKKRRIISNTFQKRLVHAGMYYTRWSIPLFLISGIRRNNSESFVPEIFCVLYLSLISLPEYK